MHVRAIVDSIYIHIQKIVDIILQVHNEINLHTYKNYLRSTTCL